MKTVNAGLLFIEPINILINDSHLASGMLGFGNHTSIPRLSLSWLAFATSDDKKERDISGLNKNTSIYFDFKQKQFYY